MNEAKTILVQAKGCKRIVFVSGNFNTLHPGHLRLLEFASKCGDYLVVGVNDDSFEGVLISHNLRLSGIKAVSYVDHAFILRVPVKELLAELQPHIVVKGKEHEMCFNEERPVLESYGGRLIFCSGEMRFSSSDLLKRDLVENNNNDLRHSVDYMHRHNIDFHNLKVIVDGFKSKNVIVVGDLIVDEYISCDALGMSQEDSSIVVSPNSSDMYVGGAGIVAAHASMLGADVKLFTVTGDDEASEYSKNMLSDYGVESTFFYDESRPTTLKKRYRVSDKTLLKVSYLRQHDIAEEIGRSLINMIKTQICDSTDILVFSDFNYGCLPQWVVDDLIEYCNKNNVLVFADSQSSSQVGDISRYKSVSLLTPTEREARLALRDFDSGLVVLFDKLYKITNSKNILITLGSEGVITHSYDEFIESWVTDRLPPFNQNPKDVAGAGDSMLICAALSLCSGASIWESMYIGSVAAACQVGKIGNVPITIDEINSFFIESV